MDTRLKWPNIDGTIKRHQMLIDKIKHIQQQHLSGKYEQNDAFIFTQCDVIILIWTFSHLSTERMMWAFDSKRWKPIGTFVYQYYCSTSIYIQTLNANCFSFHLKMQFFNFCNFSVAFRTMCNIENYGVLYPMIR